MEGFYKELKKGKSKDLALQSTKIKQIESADKLYAHPVYWAAFAPMGDMKAIYSKVDTTLLYIGGFLAAILFFFLLRSKNKSNRANAVVRKIMKERPWSKVGF